MDSRKLAALEALIGHHFRQPRYAKQAMSHSSHQHPDMESNERMEFLGDSILNFVVSEELFARYADLSEGEMSRIKSVVVSSKTLARIGRDLRLRDFLFLGKGIAQEEELPDSVFANTVEALIAALFFDGGLEESRRFILDRLGLEIARVRSNRHDPNYKSILQQYAQRELRQAPVYRVVSEQGPDHGKEFHVSVVLRGNPFPPATGRTKKDAEQGAAKNALDGLGLVVG